LFAAQTIKQTLYQGDMTLLGGALQRELKEAKKR
jgi:hypothetical protein